ncbi:alpha/beta fold hydrolase [Nocardia otitidiscaviarum]|uniref:alpha/beta fold hydrolase n=1 Tax=Nocardia otitidiscaviarum TaxID=1823 RepID=UPI0018944270|nr:alpha/beta fold hydrolase [Nocardia otitidiscaviarum]MBF6178613.1 alpha/beta fold hydrolase [Nocardia otitidiscaviarum]
MDARVARLLDAHAAAGRYVEVGGVRTFVRDVGAGPSVLLLHGVPVSSYLWRNVLGELAGRGLRGIAPDLPGLGLSERPEGFDYSWSGLGRHVGELIREMGLERVHLVVHDIGGPVGFEAVAADPGRIASLTVLDTVVAASSFRKPWSMRPIEVPGVNRIWLAGARGPVFRALMRRIGLAADTSVTGAEIDVHRALLTRGDGGRAFLRIMRSFETTPEKERLYRGVLGAHEYPVQVVWARDDPALTLTKHGRQAAEAAGLAAPDVVAGRHFFPEDSAPAIADRIAALVERAQS